MKIYAEQKEDKLDQEEMRRSMQATEYKDKIMKALDQQAKDKTKQEREEKMRQDALEKFQLQQIVEKDEKLLAEEKKKVEEKKKLGQQWMLAAEELYQKNLEQAKNGANRGQKMSPEELKFNKHILKEVRDVKRKGEFLDLHEKCSSKKITNL